MTLCYFFCLDTKEITKEKVKTYEKYVVGDMKKTHAFACDIIKPPDGSRSAQNKLAMKSIAQTVFCDDASLALFHVHIILRSGKNKERFSG